MRWEMMSWCGDELVVGQGFPVGKVQHGQFRGKKAQLLFKSLGTLAVGSQQQGEAFGGSRRFGNRQGQRSTGQIAPGLLTVGGGKAG